METGKKGGRIVSAFSLWQFCYSAKPQVQQPMHSNSICLQNIHRWMRERHRRQACNCTFLGTTSKQVTKILCDVQYLPGKWALTCCLPFLNILGFESSASSTIHPWRFSCHLQYESGDGGWQNPPEVQFLLGSFCPYWPLFHTSHMTSLAYLTWAFFFLNT